MIFLFLCCYIFLHSADHGEEITLDLVSGSLQIPKLVCETNTSKSLYCTDSMCLI